ncbi:MAG: hypothetical protein CM1200mP20_03130 [Pseudomonadota bacterium]|nr:MAG: hypothetical protein CM1200mP20_03130 [Pseudomonadota bacterium]
MVSADHRPSPFDSAMARCNMNRVMFRMSSPGKLIHIPPADLHQLTVPIKLTAQLGGIRHEKPGMEADLAETGA